jgi:putative hydrolase of HD superfamily
MALIHDMAESLVGDITPVDGVEKGEKSRRESETMVFLTKTLLGNVKNGGQEAAASLLEIWQEYETNETL